MNTQQKSTKATPGTTTLIVDFSNGAQKVFTNLPCEPVQQLRSGRQGMSVIDVLDQAQAKQPGLSYEFKGFTNRAGWEVGTLAAVDGIIAAPSKRQWQVWINQTPVSELRRITPESVTMFTDVRPGDVVLLKLVEAP